jgi:hypothetical protein
MDASTAGAKTSGGKWLTVDGLLAVGLWNQVVGKTSVASNDQANHGHARGSAISVRWTKREGTIIGINSG